MEEKVARADPYFIFQTRLQMKSKETSADATFAEEPSGDADQKHGDDNGRVLNVAEDFDWCIVVVACLATVSFGNSRMMIGVAVGVVWWELIHHLHSTW